MSPVRPKVQVVGRRLEAEDYRLRDFLTRTAQPYDWLEAGSVEADELLDRVGLAGAELPVARRGGRHRAHRRERRDDRARVGRLPAGEARALRLRRGRRRSGGPRGRGVRGVRRAVDARVRRRRAGRPVVVHGQDRELLRLPRRHRRRRARAARRPAGGAVRRRADLPARGAGQQAQRTRRAGRAVLRATAPRSPRLSCSPPREWSGGVSRSTASTSCSAAACTTARVAARRRSARDRAWSSSAPGTPPARPSSTSRTRPRA